MKFLYKLTLTIVFLHLLNVGYSQNDNRLNEGIRLSHKGEYDKADNIFSEMLIANPNDEKALTNRGYNSLWQRRYNLAEDDFKKALLVNPSNLDAMAGLASTLSANHKYAEAEKIFNIILGKSSTNLNALEGRAYNNLWSGKYAEALNDFTLLVEAGNPKNGYYTALAQIHSFLNPLVLEVGGSVGAMNCFTDLGGGKGVGKKFFKDFNLKTTRPCVGAYFTATYQNIVAARFEMTYGIVTAYDSILKNVSASTFGRYERNLSFRSSIFEAALIGEFHPLYLLQKNDIQKTLRTSPYVLLGIGYFHFNPKAKLNNTWVPLQPLHTEGQGFPEYPDRKNYKLTQINFPLGFGVKCQMSPRVNFRAEFVYRILRTDYLDDVSNTTFVNPALFQKYLSPDKAAQAEQLYNRHKPGTPYGGERGNPHRKDSYFSLNLKLGYILGKNKILPEDSRILPRQ